MYTLFSLALFLFVNIQSLEGAGCGHSHYMEHLYERNPNLREEMLLRNERIEIELRKQELREKNDDRRRQTPSPIYSVPVVVHIIYNKPDQNVPIEAIKDQIARLNIDYRKVIVETGTIPQFKSLEADSAIQFYLATVDPNGNPTTGITRTNTSKILFPDPKSSQFNSDCQKSITGGRDIWNRDRYMNIWVCNLGGDVLGYAQNPGGPSDTDGIVISTKAFGAYKTTPPYNRGKTLTHEVGHWFNLEHPWGSNTGECVEEDDVADTPIVLEPNYGCDLTHVSCSNLNMAQNYMDYSDDKCMTLFTKGQAARMRAEFALTGDRKGLANVTYGGQEILGMNNYVSPYPDEDDTDGDQLSDELSGVDLKKFTSGTWFYVIIGVAGCIGLTLICVALVSIKRCASKKK